MIHKESEILRFVEAANNRGWATVDHWEADLCAIGVVPKEDSPLLAYVSTAGKKSGFYDFEIERRDSSQPLGYLVSGKGRDVDCDELMRILDESFSEE